ncbi:MAG: response regulator [Chitinispirillaceae bacterium]|nr:response regulator [Chitinispirillaceae bacterium]
MNGSSKAKKNAGSGTANPFAFLDGTLSLLLVEDDPEQLAFLRSLTGGFPCYSVATASDNSGAIDRLRSGKRVHTCITDLGITDIGGDEFYLLRQYARHCSMIVLTGSTSPQKGATCIQLGARTVFDKGAPFHPADFMRTVNELTLISIVNHRYSESSGDTFNLATKILLKTNPRSVTEWADNLRITDRQLRNLWHTGSGFGAKHLLFLYQCCKSAFRYFESQLFLPETRSRFSPPSTPRHMAAYFENHRELLTFLLS